MKTKKMGLANIQRKLSRAEMKKIMAGSGDNFSCMCTNGQSAGMADCSNCDCYCNGHCYGNQQSCS